MTSHSVRIALTGVKHSGKSAVAREITALTKRASADTDQLICDAYDVGSPRYLYETKGVGGLRDAELRIVEQLDLTYNSDLFVATGGGLADNGPALARLAQTFSLVYLAEDPRVLYDRVMAGGRPPFLPEAGTYLAFMRLFTRRDRTYRRWADLVYPIEGQSVEAVARGVLRIFLNN